MSERLNIFDLSLEQIAARLAGWGEPAYRARQVWHALYGRLSAAPQEMTDLPAALRVRLAESLCFASLEPIAEASTPSGYTHKTLFRLPDGYRIETVLMRHRKGHSLCVSTQAGCAMGCIFCGTGQAGFMRHLTSGEIVEQVIYFARRLAARSHHLSNIVMMGMGEPFHNYDATVQALDRLSDPYGFQFGARRITVSTVGLVPVIIRFASERRQTNLAVSLHAATDDLRDRLVPVNRRYPLESLIRACHTYVGETSRRISFEWAMIKDVNDGLDQAKALLRLLDGLNCHVNVIPLNPTRQYGGEASSIRQVEAFAATLRSGGIPCTVRVRRGIKIRAGCGQLAADNPIPEPLPPAPRL